MRVDVVLRVGRRTAIQNALLAQVVVIRAPHGIIGRVGQINAPGGVGGHHKSTARAVALVEDGPHLVGVVVGRNHIGFRQAVAHVHLHDVHIPVDANPTEAVVARGTNHARHRGAVAARRDVVVVGTRVPAVVVVDKTVLVVVDAVVRDFSGVHPVVVDQVDVVVVGTAALQDRHHDA